MDLNKPLLLRADKLASIVSAALTPCVGGHTDRTRYVNREIKIENRVAVVDVDGILLERADAFDAMIEEGLSTNALTVRVEELRQNPDVSIVVFNIASPGGEVGGIQNAASAIFSLRESGKKTIAYINSCACSGAYWIAAACEEVILSSETSETGSIGVVIAHREVSGLEQRLGIKTTEVTSGEQKRIVSFYEPITAEGKEELAARAAKIHEVFKNDLKKFRPALVRNDEKAWGDGQIFIGGQAIDVGLADKIEYIPNLFSIGEHDVDLNKLKTDFPLVYAAAVQIGRDEAKTEAQKTMETARLDGVSTERARVTAILDVKMESYEGAKAKAIREGQTVEALSVAIVQGKIARDEMPAAPTLPTALTDAEKKQIVLAAMRGEAPKVVASSEPALGKIQIAGKEMTKEEFEASLSAAVSAANKS